MALLTHDRYCDEVITQTDLLRDTLQGADLSLDVPTCPDWTLAQLVRHIGGNLRELGADGFTWRRGHEKATVALRGPLTDVLRVFYRRLPADSERVEVLGEAALLDFWLERVSLQ